jgi:choline dehydrogenase-like flavoprotein
MQDTTSCRTLAAHGYVGLREDKPETDVRRETELDWGFVAAPNPHLNGRAISYSMGKVLGGGSSVNVGTWSRGHKADWDGYAAETGDPAWGYEAVLDLYRRRIEGWTGTPDPGYRGSGGPMHVQPAPNLTRSLRLCSKRLKQPASSGLRTRTAA